MAKKNNVALYLFGILIVAILFMGMIYNPFKQNAVQAGNPNAVTTTSGGAACPYQETVAVTGLDALVSSTAATPTTVNYIVNDVYRGTSAPSVVKGDKWKIVGDLAGYLADVQEATIQCGANNIVTHPYAYANATTTFKDDPVTSSNTLTNGGGLLNATKTSAGGQRNLPVIFQGTSQKSTGKIYWLIESPASMATNISSITVSCNGAVLPSVNIPSAIAASNAGSLRTAVEVPAIVSAASTNCNVQIQATATGVANGLFKNTFYAEQKFVDSNGVVQEGIYDTTPNGNNAAKYQDTYTYNVMLQ